MCWSDVFIWTAFGRKDEYLTLDYNHIFLTAILTP